MHYQICNVDDEFEPRVTPKPTTKSNSFVTPSVPEVSLIFDKPVEQKLAQVKNSNSPVSDPNGSYATWKEQNFSWRTSTSKAIDSFAVHKAQYNQSQSFSQENSYKKISEYGQHDYTPRKSSDREFQRQKESNIDYNQERNANYCMHQSQNRIPLKESYNRSVQHENKIHGRSTQGSPQNLKTCHDTGSPNSCSPLHERKVLSHSGPVNEASMHNLHSSPNVFSTENKYPHVPHLGYPYPYLDVNGCPFPQFYMPGYPNHNMDSNETVKNLLQLVNNQSEQIKTLQMQIDRLIKLQEQNLREKSKCVCLSREYQQNTQLYIDSCDVNTSSYTTQNQNSGKNVPRNIVASEKSKENVKNAKDTGQSELLGEQSKKAFVEQKVSIGVMTSFEFTVQNNPFVVDSEDCSGNEQNTETLHEENKNLHDTTDALRRYKTFSRIPRGQLENIVEDSESYLSSSHQHSSNLNASSSTKVVELDKQNHMDIPEETNVYNVRNSQSPKLYTDIPTNQDKGRKQVYIEKAFTDERRKEDIRKKPEVQMNMQTTPAGFRNHTLNATVNTNPKVGMQTDSYSVKKNSIDTTTSNYCKDYSTNKYDTKQNHYVEESLILSGADLKVNERPPTPEPSIHVEMQEYSSDDDSDKIKRTSKVGWTFYNNVLGQVNQILQDSCVTDKEQKEAKAVHHAEQDDKDNKTMMDTVKVATLEQLRKLGISIAENSDHREVNGNQRVEFDSSFYPRFDCQANMTNTTSAINETNTSMHMKALALKYLSDEQLAELALQKHGSTSLKQLMLSNMQGTNMSFATMRYLERYQLLPGKNNVPIEGDSKIVELPSKPDVKSVNPKSPMLQRFPFSQTPRTSCPSKILDISTLKQQPKLL